MAEYFMGIDIGISGVKAALFNRKGSQKSLLYTEYPMMCIDGGMAELDPDVVLDSLLGTAKDCLESAGVGSIELEAIGLSSQLFSFMAVDSDGNKLTNIMTEEDMRSMAQSDWVKSNFNCNMLYKLTGCRVQHPMYPLGKILWLKQTKPDIFEKVYKFVTIKEYILQKLFGVYVIDTADASATACFNIHKLKWDETVLKEVLGVGSDKFGQPVDCTHPLKGIKKAYAERMGLDYDIPVVVGSGDGILANYGCGAVDDASMSCAIGSSGVLRIAANKPLFDPQQRTWCYCFTKDTWVTGGTINNGGNVLDWLRGEYTKQYEYEAHTASVNSIFELFDRYAAEIAPGSDGLIFLPFLTGEKSPCWNTNAGGTLHGLRFMHGKKHFIRASMEGIMLSMFSIYEALAQLNTKPKQIIANGGYANSDIWLQMQADIFNHEIAIAGVSEAAVFGAACTAMVSVGVLRDFKTPLECSKPQRIIKPNEGNIQVYRESFKLFKEIYTKLD